MTDTAVMTESRKGFRLALVSEYKVTAADWLQEGWIERNALHFLYGPSGSLKSFLLVHWLMDIAITTQQPVAAIIGEGLRGFIARIHAACIVRGVDIATVPIFVSTRATFLNDPEAVQDVIATLTEVEVDFGKPAVVAIDTLARNSVGANESSTKEAGEIIGGLDAIRNAFGSAVIVLHHTGWADQSRIRGSSALLGAADFAHAIEKDTEGVARLRCVKSKDSAEPDPRAFTLADVELNFKDPKGQPIHSAVVREIAYTEPKKQSGNTGRGKWQRKALEVLERLYEKAERNVEASGRDRSEARVEVKTWRVECLEAGMPNNRFHDVKTSLEEAMEIRTEGPHVFL